MQDKIVKNSILTLENRKNIKITGVQSVDGFSEQTLSLTINDNKLKIVGEKLKIISFDKVTGEFNADGVINDIKYNAKKQPLIKRLFK